LNYTEKKKEIILTLLKQQRNHGKKEGFWGVWSSLTWEKNKENLARYNEMESPFSKRKAANKGVLEQKGTTAENGQNFPG